MSSDRAVRPGDVRQKRPASSRHSRATLNLVLELCTWFSKLFYANLIWAGLSLAGGVVLGIFPATVALYIVIHRELVGEFEGTFLTTFVRAYRSQFWKSNALGYSIVGIALLLVIDFLYFDQLSFEALRPAKDLALAMGLALLLFLLYIFPACAHFGAISIAVVKKAIGTIYRAPVTTVLLLAACVVVGYVFIVLPAFLIVMGVPAFGLATSWTAERGFSRIWH